MSSFRRRAVSEQRSCEFQRTADHRRHKSNRKRSVSADCFRIVMAFCFLCTAFSILHGIFLSQSRRLPLLQVVSNNKSFSVGVQSPTEINAPRGCAVILKRICQLMQTRITRQVSRMFDLNKLRSGDL